VVDEGQGRRDVNKQALLASSREHVTRRR
jgi:hypothetical protein